MLRSDALWLIALAAMSWVSIAQAANDVWDGNGAVPPSNIWSLGLSWADNSTPGNSDTATFNLNTAYTARLIANPAAIQTLTVSNGNVTFDSDTSTTRTLSVTSANGSQDVVVTGASTFLTLGSAPLNDVHLIAGDELSVQNDATLTAQFGSDITAARFSSFGLSGSIIMDGPAASLVLTSAGADNFIGRSGNTGYLLLVNGTFGNDIAGNLGLADSGVANSSGFVAIVAGSVLTLDGNLTLANVGVAGQSASLDIYDANSRLTQNGASSITVGSDANGTAAINIAVPSPSGRLTTGTGTFTINRTGTVTIGSGANSGILNANGNVVINGGTLKRSVNSDINLAAGRSMTIQNGGLFDVTGDYSANGTYTVTDAGSTWTNNDFVFVANGGNGIVTIEDGGAVTFFEGAVGASAGREGTATVTGAGSTWTNSGELIVGLFGTGTFTIEDGGAVSNTTGTVGNFAGSDGAVIVTGAGSTWTNNGTFFYVGREGTGSLTISAGGSVTNTFGYVGSETLSEGTVTVTGAGSIWTNSADLRVGGEGTGSLTISAGGRVFNTAGYVGDNTLSTGTVTVTGAGSTWTNSASLSIGNFGNGTLVIQQGGDVLSGGTGGFIGVQDGIVGAVTVTGTGSTWANNSFLDIGLFGSGMLKIEAGGAVSNADVVVGRRVGSDGDVNVSGASSTWTNNGPLQLGLLGTGKLTVMQGGAVSSTIGSVGVGAGSVGAATISDAGSTWTTSALSIGGSMTQSGGSGALNVKSGGLVRVNGNTIVWNNGTIDLQAGGTFDARGTIDLNGGSFNFLGGTLHVDNFVGDLRNQGGTLAPGHSAGATNIDGEFVQQAGATLQIEIGGTTAGTQFDTIKVSGQTTLAGTLAVSLINSFTPAPGNGFQILESGGQINGTFATELLPALAGGLFLDVEYSQNKVVLFTRGVLGDYNLNGTVDGAEYVVWRNTLGQSGVGLAADGNANNQIDAGDLSIWRAHFGQSAGSGNGTSANTAVPEQTALPPIVLAVAWCLLRCRKRPAPP